MELHSDARALRYVSQSINSSGQVRWFPAYGCALLTPHGEWEPGGSEDVPLLLVGLDDWAFTTHRQASDSGGVVHTDSKAHLHTYPVHGTLTVPASDLALQHG